MEKQIIIIEEKKKVKTEKEKKMRIETQTWNLSEEELTHEYQLNTIHQKHKYITSHIKSKINSYKQQDIIKNKFNSNEFVSYSDVVDLLYESQLLCHYCSDKVYILYEKVRESKQWSLDRINNDIGHNKGNLVIACLSCNLKRRRTNKDAFLFTKNMVIVKTS
jgi:hypothetical protein